MSDLTKQQRIEAAALAYESFMDLILPDWREDPNSKDTPKRVAKMFINELYNGIYGPDPKITSFPNVDKYDGIVFSGRIEVKSQCSHHHMPFFGQAYIAYIPESNGKIVGLSKLNRITDFFSRRPQVQENLTMQIHKEIERLIEKTKGVAVHIEAYHTCVNHRGVNQNSIMKTTKLSGLFFTNEIGTRDEFYRFIADSKKNG